MIILSHILGLITSLIILLTWNFGIRTHLRKMKRPHVVGANIAFCIYGDWQECSILAKSGDAKASQLTRTFICVHIGYVIALLVGFL
jgi:hypothetical protein